MRIQIIILCFSGIWPSLASAQQKVTFSEHIAPIIFKNCSTCHHDGTAAPFSLLTFQDVAKRAKMIETVTRERYMPPWKADAAYRSFSNEKVLTDVEIRLIRDWVDQGMTRGPKRKQPSSPVYPRSYHLAAPDAVLKVRTPFTIPGDGTENFVFFVIPFEFEKENNVVSVEYTSTNYKIVHHANFGVYAVEPAIAIYGDSSAIHAREISRYGRRYAELTQNLVYYNGWVPGATPIHFTNDIGFKMPKRGVVILTNHYSPSAVQTEETTSLNFFFGSTPVTRQVRTLSIGSGGVGEISPPLILFANEINSFRVQMEIVKPLSLMYVWPHMHLLGKSFKAYCVTSVRDTIPLISIPSWDFNWQEAYKFRKLVKLPAGAVLTVEGVYDNTAGNPKNPFSPPRMIVSEGLMETKNEMLSLIIVYAPYAEGDEYLEQR